jgi:hypothetical protein
MKIVGVVIAALVPCGVGWGAYAYYMACDGFNSCVNPACQSDRYVDGKRVR